jgi:hypothetical protein
LHNHQREGSGELDCQGFLQISGIVSSPLRGYVREEIQFIDRVRLGPAISTKESLSSDKKMAVVRTLDKKIFGPIPAPTITAYYHIVDS